MYKAFILHISLLFPVMLYGQEIPERMEGGRMINDYSSALSDQEKDELEVLAQQIRINHDIECVIVLLSDRVKRDVVYYSDSLASMWTLSENSIVILADVQQGSYGIHIGEKLSSFYPSWVVQKIQDNQLRSSFRDKQYFKGLKEAMATLTDLKTGKISINEFKKEESSSGFLFLGVALGFFILIFPIVQFILMKRSHLASRPMDFVSSVLLLNYFGTRGKNVFDNFSKSKGSFSVQNQSIRVGGNGVKGKW